MLDFWRCRSTEDRNSAFHVSVHLNAVPAAPHVMYFLWEIFTKAWNWNQDICRSCMNNHAGHGSLRHIWHTHNVLEMDDLFPSSVAQWLRWSLGFNWAESSFPCNNSHRTEMDLVSKMLCIYQTHRHLCNLNPCQYQVAYGNPSSCKCTHKQAPPKGTHTI
jgi:hypothetical protein